MSKIYLYAELLLHIRQVTLFAILPSNCDQSTRLDLCPDNRTIHVTHNGELATIELPCAVLANKKLQIPSSPGLELSFRLAVGAHVGLTAQVQQGNDVYGPWSASMLTAETLISCQSCGRLLTKDVTTWKDLPSEGWAEMMDFWHCHKPSVQHESDPQAGSKKGYASSNALRPTKGIGLVDVLHLWISESNYVGFNVSDLFPLLIAFAIFFHK